MALVQCPECGHKVSDRAEECPKCGYPLHKREEEAGNPAATKMTPVSPILTEQPKKVNGLPQTPPKPKESAREAMPAVQTEQKDKRLLPYIIGFVLLMLVVGAGLWWVFFQEPSDAGPEKTEASAALLDTSTGPAGQSNIPEKRTFTVNGVSFTMVTVEGGTFMMGATPEQQNPYEDEEPAHQVTLSTYSIGETEVTQELWYAVMGTNPFWKKDDKLPADDITQYECLEFIQKLNNILGESFRLPTEAEWEFAARGGTKSRGYQYSGSNTLNDVAWYKNNSNGLQPVGTKDPNELGLYDMSGNVEEWCADMYSSYNPDIVESNTPAPIRRGGGSSSEMTECRVACRGEHHLQNHYYSVGFRLAL